ncbi:ribosome maturation factor RimM [Hyphomonas sp.]|uniref:ribosome maturation factor RimM n=1 Tax=Hyphomonas sp. TaxID=87 RepID=UPI0025BF0E3A|nr:ribosome maturation factor RimM [Hyphomonas sp.]MBI1399867.1 16S rRNA processing protein RimM [Hyphomonas sp.]
MPAKTDDRLIAVGVLKGAHGVRGEVRVKSYTADPEALFGYGPLTDEYGAVVLTPKSARPGKDHFIVRPKEMKQKEDWDALRGRLLYVPRARLPAAEEDEFYIEDLAGLDVYAGGEAPAGRIRSVQNFGSGDLLEVEVPGLPSTVFVPFTRADVPVVDMAARRVMIPELQMWSEPGTRPEEESGDE